MGKILAISSPSGRFLLMWPFANVRSSFHLAHWIKSSLCSGKRARIRRWWNWIEFHRVSLVRFRIALSVFFSESYPSRSDQITAFTEQLRLAKQLNKPVIIVSRGSFLETLHILLEVSLRRSVFYRTTPSTELRSWAKTIRSFGGISATLWSNWIWRGRDWKVFFLRSVRTTSWIRQFDPRSTQSIWIPSFRRVLHHISKSHK